MKTEYLPTFVKDLKALKSTPVYTTIKNIAFEDIIPCQNLSDISNLKKLKAKFSLIYRKNGFKVTPFILYIAVAKAVRTFSNRETTCGVSIFLLTR
jgi:hypothetical protein